jgi:hypothetical protein
LLIVFVDFSVSVRVKIVSVVGFVLVLSVSIVQFMSNKKCNLFCLVD